MEHKYYPFQDSRALTATTFTSLLELTPLDSTVLILAVQDL
jgi:hypothetical protein